ncbi:MAG: serine/threonine protein kinase [Rhodothermales bacterium]|jgi:serine/threonine protein kinase
MDTGDDNDFAAFLHEQYDAVRLAIEQPLNAQSGSYRDAECIGEGAQKQVFRVYDEGCSREVAMAVLKDHEPAATAQFLREGRLTALLQHPNIMPVYATGINDDGKPFFTMRLLSARSLASEIQDDADVLTLLNAFIKVCEAMAYAHSQGVVHRDLKPENINIGEFGEVLVSDWGLAAIEFEHCDEQILTDELLHDIDLKVSLKGVVKGTPGYIAPELLSAPNAHSIASDIYALGAILHVILTRELPVASATAEQALASTRAGEIHPFADSAEVPSGLRAVCAKALAVAPAGRYADVPELIADLEKYLSGFATDAEDAGIGTQLRLFYQRNRSVCRLTVFFALTLVLVLAAFVQSIRIREQHATKLASELRTAQEQRQLLAAAMGPQRLEDARTAFRGDDLEPALALCRIVYELEPDNPEARALYGKALMARQEFSQAVTILDGIAPRFAEIAKTYAKRKTAARLEHRQLMQFLKDIGPEPEEEAAYIYRHILFEEFELQPNLERTKDLIAAELRYRNPKMRTLNFSISKAGDSYDIDISDNPQLTTPFIFEKLGPIAVRTLDLSNSGLINLHHFAALKVERLHMRNTQSLNIEPFAKQLLELGAEGSQADVSRYLQGSRVERLNIHGSAFSNYAVLPSLLNLRLLTVSRGKLPANIRAKLPSGCEVIEK